MRIDARARSDFLDAYQQWRIEEEALIRTFRFENFNEAMGFVVRVALLAETADHHPDIDIRWNEVTITLSTHSEGALTSQDTSLAAEIDGL